MKIELRYQVTPDDYCEFQRAYAKNRRILTPRNQRGFRSPFAIMWVVVAVIVLGNCIYSSLLTPSPAAVPPPPPPTLKESLLELLPYVVIFFVSWSFLFWVLRSRFIYRRVALQAMRVDEPRSAEITDAQLTIREPAAVTTMEWSHFSRFIETKSLFLLFVVPRVAHVIPKRAFASPQAVVEFRLFAQSHIGNQPIGFPVQPPGTRDAH